MTDQEFDTLLVNAVAELKAKQHYLDVEFGLGRFERFFIDYETGELQFFDASKMVLAFTFTAVGSHVPAKKSWRWSWANASLPPNVREKASGARKLFDITGFDVFRQENVSADEAMAWEFVALVCKASGALGGYSMPQRELRAYVLLDSVKKGA